MNIFLSLFSLAVKIIIQNIWYHIGLISSISKDLKNEKYALAYLHRAFFVFVKQKKHQYRYIDASEIAGEGFEPTTSGL